MHWPVRRSLGYRWKMAFELDETRRIHAPIEVVWSVLTDHEAYPEWNPFVVGIRSSLVVGEPIRMRVRIVPPIVQPQRETVFECVPPERLVYGLDGAAIRSRRSHELAADDAAATRYRSHFRLEGPLAPLTRRLLGRRLEIGFASMTRALAQRAEQLHREAAATASTRD
jgi:uncharacterized protein YndB with AHSA1/START domain